MGTFKPVSKIHLLIIFIILGDSVHFSTCVNMWTSLEQRQAANKTPIKRCVSPCKIFHSWCKNEGKCREKGQDCTWYCECPDNCDGFFCEKILTEDAAGGGQKVEVKIMYEKEKKKDVSAFDKSKLAQALAGIYMKKKQTDEEKKNVLPETIDRVGKTIDTKENVTATVIINCPPGETTPKSSDNVSTESTPQNVSIFGNNSKPDGLEPQTETTTSKYIENITTKTQATTKQPPVIMSSATQSTTATQSAISPIVKSSYSVSAKEEITEQSATKLQTSTPKTHATASAKPESILSVTPTSKTESTSSISTKLLSSVPVNSLYANEANEIKTENKPNLLEIIEKAIEVEFISTIIPKTVKTKDIMTTESVPVDDSIMTTGKKKLASITPILIKSKDQQSGKKSRVTSTEVITSSELSTADKPIVTSNRYGPSPKETVKIKHATKIVPADNSVMKIKETKTTSKPIESKNQQTTPRLTSSVSTSKTKSPITDQLIPISSQTLKIKPTTKSVANDYSVIKTDETKLISNTSKPIKSKSQQTTQRLASTQSTSNTKSPTTDQQRISTTPRPIKSKKQQTTPRQTSTESTSKTESSTTEQPIVTGDTNVPISTKTIKSKTAIKSGSVDNSVMTTEEKKIISTTTGQTQSKNQQVTASHASSESKTRKTESRFVVQQNVTGDITLPFSTGKLKTKFISTIESVTTKNSQIMTTETKIVLTTPNSAKSKKQRISKQTSTVSTTNKRKSLDQSLVTGDINVLSSTNSPSLKMTAAAIISHDVPSTTELNMSTSQTVISESSTTEGLNFTPATESSKGSQTSPPTTESKFVKPTTLSPSKTSEQSPKNIPTEKSSNTETATNAQQTMVGQTSSETTPDPSSLTARHISVKPTDSKHVVNGKNRGKLTTTLNQISISNSEAPLDGESSTKPIVSKVTTTSTQTVTQPQKLITTVKASTETTSDKIIISSPLTTNTFKTTNIQTTDAVSTTTDKSVQDKSTSKSAKNKVLTTEDVNSKRTTKNMKSSTGIIEKSTNLNPENKSMKLFTTKTTLVTADLNTTTSDSKPLVSITTTAYPNSVTEKSSSSSMPETSQKPKMEISTAEYSSTVSKNIEMTTSALLAKETDVTESSISTPSSILSDKTKISDSKIKLTKDFLDRKSDILNKSKVLTNKLPESVKKDLKFDLLKMELHEKGLPSDLDNIIL